MSAAPALPPDVQVIERGWLSSNSIVCFDHAAGGRTAIAAIIDTGYCGEAEQTLALLNSALATRRHATTLTRIINTHAHADHVGGNAALQRQHAGARITVPAGIAASITTWDEDVLLLASAGQRGERFVPDDTLAPGATFEAGGLHWQALAAPGHDMHALVFWNARTRLLISGDALWHDGLGVVFGALLGDADALPAARRTLDMIEQLDAAVVIPGHGAPFADVAAALTRARGRLDALAQSTPRLARSALKALLSFNLLDQQRLRVDTLADYLAAIPLFRRILPLLDLPNSTAAADWLVEELKRSGTATTMDGWLTPRTAA